MLKQFYKSQTNRLVVALVALIFASSLNIYAHPLGNFTINHFTRIEIDADRARVRFVVDMAEIPTLQELQRINRDYAQTNDKANESAASLSNSAPQIPPRAALEKYAAQTAQEYSNNLILNVNGAHVPLELIAQNISLPPGAGGLPTLRLECDLIGKFDAQTANSIVQNSALIHFEDANHTDRIGWREIMVASNGGVQIFDSTAFGNGISGELKSYPENMLTAPLNERAADFSATRSTLPANARPLQTRDGKIVVAPRDRLAELVNVRELTFGAAIFGLLLAVGLGAAHAFSPGHGKTVVGAYLVGARGTARHALFLGLTVTVTHTAGVFALGLITLFASHLVAPEKLMPVLSLVSGALVLALGVSLFFARLRAAFGIAEHAHNWLGMHTNAVEDDPTHTHLPPGANGGRVTWKSLLALGVSGGLLPCPSALVVMLAAITIGRVAYGLALVVAFSIGLAATLTAIGLLFVYAGRLIKTPSRESVFGKLARVLPALSAFVIASVGAVLCYEALMQANFHPFDFNELMNAFRTTNSEEPELARLSAFTILALGLVFGLKHATEADHIVAVSSIVSEHKNIFRAGLVGGLWGAGHTLSLVIVGFLVLALRVEIPERIAGWLEFGVALMIIGLGANALYRALRGRGNVQAFAHAHDGMTAHAHLQIREDGDAPNNFAPLNEGKKPPHIFKRIGIKPLFVGMMHGLAGSAALTLLVLTQIGSMSLGLLYLLIFGVGSICGMLLMSSLIGLPFVLSAQRLVRFNHMLQTLAGALSIAFGLWYAYKTI
jgi:nickel/cobalt exporter